jgi:hypothetical protein
MSGAVVGNKEQLKPGRPIVGSQGQTRPNEFSYPMAAFEAARQILQEGATAI